MRKHHLKEAEWSDSRENVSMGKFKSPSLHRTMKSPAKTVRINFIRTLEKHGVFIATKKMLKTERATESEQDSSVLSGYPWRLPSPFPASVFGCW